MMPLRNKLALRILPLLTLLMSSCNANGIYNILNSTTPMNFVSTDYRVFVTSILTPGDMSFNNLYASCPGTGIANANCICQQLAIAGQLANGTTTFRAWLSDSTTSAICNIQGVTGASCGINNGSYRYVDYNNMVIFYSGTDIANGGFPINPITTTEMNTQMFSFVWTGTQQNGTVTTTGNHCTNWTANPAGAPPVPLGLVGDSSVTGSWTDAAALSQNCDTLNSYPIYCFEGP